LSAIGALRHLGDTLEEVRRRRAVGALSVVVLVVGCGLDVRGSAAGGGQGEGGVDASLPGDEDGGFDAGNGGDASVGGDDAATDAPIDGGALIYATSATELWTFDPATHVFANLGTMPNSCKHGSEPLDEVAVDGTGAIWADSRDTDALLRVANLSPLICASPVSSSNVPYALTFVPKGTVSSVRETLVGYSSSSYYKLDTATGNVTTIAGDPLGAYSASGDVVYGGGKMYVSVINGVDCVATDCLYEADPTTGNIGAKVVTFPVQKVWGLGYGLGKIYAFANDGTVYEVTPGSPATMLPVLVPPNVKWYGAGSATTAP
jgi:hypothetical protein